MAEGVTHLALLHTITRLHVCTCHMCDHRHLGTVTGGAYVFSWMKKTPASLTSPFSIKFSKAQTNDFVPGRVLRQS